MAPELAAIPLDAIDGWVGALSAIPDAARVYDVTPRRAELEFGITSAIADALIERGLSVASVDGVRRYSWHDLHYLGLRLGSAQPYLRTMRSWAQALATAESRGAHTVQLRYRVYADPGTPLEVMLPGDRRESMTVGADPIVAELAVEMANPERAFPPELADVFAAAAGFDFYFLPPALVGDLEFARRVGLAGCLTASRLVVQECRALGIQARMAYGLLLAPPLGTPHEWAEIRLGDAWIAADPLLLSILGRFAGLDRARWPVGHSPGAVLVRLSGDSTGFVTGPTGPVKTSYLVSVGE